MLSDLFVRSESDTSSASCIFLAKSLGMFNIKYSTTRPKSITEASERIVKIYEDVASGVIPEDKGKYLIGFLESYIKSKEIGELEQRITKLEEKSDVK